MSNSKDVLWVRKDVFGNRVSLYVKTWENHTSKHTFDKYPLREEHIYQTVIDPDHARRSTAERIGHETCVFERFFPDEQAKCVVPVIYNGVEEAGDYDQGGKQGRVSTGYLNPSESLSRNIGDIIWSRQVSQETFISTETSASGSEDPQ